MRAILLDKGFTVRTAFFILVFLLSLNAEASRPKPVEHRTSAEEADEGGREETAASHVTKNPYGRDASKDKKRSAIEKFVTELLDGTGSDAPSLETIPKDDSPSDSER